jgi:hypothetical protein
VNSGCNATEATQGASSEIASYQLMLIDRPSQNQAQRFPAGRLFPRLIFWLLFLLIFALFFRLVLVGCGVCC